MLHKSITSERCEHRLHIAVCHQLTPV